MEKNSRKDQKKKTYQIDVNGSLGLLAYGDLGLKAWRKVKTEYNKKKKENL